MPDLMARPVHRHMQRCAQRPCGSLADEEAGHVGAFGVPGSDRDSDPVDLRRELQLLQQCRELHRMVKDRIALPQTLLAGAYRKKLLLLAHDMAFAVIESTARGVVAGIQPQKNCHYAVS